MLKFTQHRDLQNELLSTGDAELVEVGCSGPILCAMSLQLFRTLPWMLSGVSEPMERVAMSSGKPLNVFVRGSAERRLPYDCDRLFVLSPLFRSTSAPALFTCIGVQ